MINGFNCGIWQGRAGLTEVWQQMMKIITAFSKKYENFIGYVKKSNILRLVLDLKNLPLL